MRRRPTVPNRRRPPLLISPASPAPIFPPPPPPPQSHALHFIRFILPSASESLFIGRTSRAIGFQSPFLPAASEKPQGRNRGSGRESQPWGGTPSPHPLLRPEA